MLRLPVVLVNNAALPTATLHEPMYYLVTIGLPTAVLLPVVLQNKALDPKAANPEPVVLLLNVLAPKAEL